MSMPLVAILAALVAGLGGWAAARIVDARRRESELQDWMQRLATLTAQLESSKELLQEARHKEGKLAEAQQQAAAYWSAMQEHVKQLEDMRQQRSRQAERLEQLNTELTRLTAREQELMTLLEQERGQNAEKLALLAEARESMAGQFKALAGDILEEKAKRFTEQNQQNLGHLLGPLQQRLQDFGKLVQDSYEKDSQGRLSLEAELKRLQELNSRLGDDAIALTKALTGASSKAQGSWGEMVLERVLETSGLQKDREYRVQVSDVVAGEDGNRRYQPDVVIDLPEGKQLVVDSKVSLNAYVRYTAAEDEAERATEMKAHVAAKP